MGPKVSQIKRSSLHGIGQPLYYRIEEKELSWEN